MMFRKEEDMVSRYHCQALSANQCGASHVQIIEAPLGLVWSVVRRFDNPQAYKRFISSCTMQRGSGGVGSVREIRVVTGMPAKTSTERLDDLDDSCHVMRFSIVGGDHRLGNYRSTMSVHEWDGACVVIESYVVDVPCESTKEETCLFTDTIVRCNLRSLAQLAEDLTLDTP